MPLTKMLEVTLTQDRFAKPLVIIGSCLGNGLEAYPAQLRALAAALCRAADDVEARPIDKKHNNSEKREYPLTV
jgi:hypothetical protein